MAVGLAFFGLLTAFGHAETFQLNDGQTLSGEIILFNEGGLRMRLDDGTHSDLVPWTKFSQADLKQLALRPKLAPLVEPFIEIPQEESLKKTEVVIKEVPRLERPAKGSLLGALFRSPLGLLMLLLIYAANIYAGREVAIFRAHPPAVVCAVSAVLPVIGPIIFLSIPSRIEKAVEERAKGDTERVSRAAAASSEPTAYAAGRLTLVHPPEFENTDEEAVPQTQVFRRGEFVFNRRFFETKFAGFFGIIRRSENRNMVLIFKTARGEYTATRITRIAANDLHVEIPKDVLSQEVMLPFAEIREVVLKHKDA